MAVNKVVMNTANGTETLIDLTADTVTPETLAAGETAHDASGAIIVGEATPVTLVQGTGTRTDAVMSQKAVKDALNKVADSVDEKADMTEGTFYVEGSGTTDATNKVSAWVGTSDRITEYYDGLTIRYKIGVEGQSTVTLNINNLGAKTVYRFSTTKLTTQFPVGSIVHLIYHADLNDGCWVTNDYDANTNTQQRVYSSTNNVEYPITARYNTTTGSSYYAEYGRYSTGVTLNPSEKTITATAFKGKLTGNADTATKATQDANGNVIADTYVDKSAISLGIASDGLIYIFVDGTPVGTGIPQSTGESGDVFGYVDENNTIVLNGNLADGTYTLKYEMGNGEIVNIGNMVLDSNVYYSITKNLTQCSINNSATQIVEGESYSATITANDGYELKSVSVTMGGSAVTVTSGKINIASVTGNIVITAVAEVKAAEPTNFLEYNSTNTTDWSIWINNARAGSDGTYRSDTVSGDYGTPVVTNYVAVQNGDIVEFGGFFYSGKNSVVYKADKTVLQAAGITSLTSYISEFTDHGGYKVSFKVNNANVGYIRIGGYIHTAYGERYLKIKRNGAYL